MGDTFTKIIEKLSKDITNKQTSLCIGTFDGVHSGHKKLFSELINVSNKNRSLAVVFVFKKRPREIINEKLSRPYILPFENRLDKIKDSSLKKVIEIDFDKKLQNLSSEEFLKTLKEKINLKSLIASVNTRIGRDQANGNDLANICKNLNIDFHQIDMRADNKKIISSSNISNLIAEGNIEEANSMLGENFYFKGNVVQGKLIRTGWDCADKLHLCEDGERNLFRTFRDKLSAERENKAGKIKAQAILESAGLTRAWELSEQKEHPNFKDHDIIVDIVRKLIRRGDISEKQIEFLHKLVNACDNFHIVQAEREAAKKVSQHLGTVGEFHQFEGTCLFQQEWETQWGWGGITVLVDDFGNKAVVFRILDCQKGDRFRFEGKVKEHGNRDGENQTIFAGRFRKPVNLSKAA